jgi:uncharacterized protein (TIGR03083 family)
MMDEDRIWQAIDAQRLSLAALLEQLSDAEWRQPSLCSGWSVRDVAAHLTLQQLSLTDALAEWVHVRRLSLDGIIHDSACRRAGWPTERIIAAIRATAGSRRHNFGVTHRETLIDILVHGQDIAVPLGRRHDLPSEAAAVAADRVWQLGAPFHARKKMAGFRLIATDSSWTAGDGLPVEAPAGTLLLVLTGRLAALPQLSGEGAPELAARLSAGSG